MAAPRTWAESYPIVASLLVLAVAMVSVQVGAAIAKTLLPALGASGTAALRLFLAAAMLLCAWRPWRTRPSRAAARSIAVYGLAMGCMNLLFYCALRTIPLGIAVALEFTGPLAVAMVASRRTLDILWIGLAAVGLLLLLPLHATRGALDRAGIGFALGAGACWAIYIVFGRRAGSLHGGQAAALGMLVGALFVVPIGIANAGAQLLRPALWPAALAVALLSSALPYSLEMFALTRLPVRTFGVLMSAEPAVAALSGLAILGERLNGTQWAAIVCIILASGGSAATIGWSVAAPMAD